MKRTESSSRNPILSTNLLKQFSALQNELLNGQKTNNTKLEIIIQELNNIQTTLNPLMVENIGLKRSLENLCKKIEGRTEISIKTHINYIPGTLDESNEVIIYKIAKEALENIELHAKAKNANINIQQSTHSILVEITDNGIGFDVMDILKSGKAIGLLHMNAWCKFLNTNADYISTPFGTKVSFEIKLL